MAEKKTDFREQIREDIKFYQRKYPYNDKLQKDEWAFNFWVLDKLFSEDEDEIENKIIEYKDFGVDCYVWHEDTKDLYLIQNKFYSDDSAVSNEYVKNTLGDAYGQLINGSYTRSKEVQTIFNKYHDHPDFFIYHYFYVTNNRVSDAIRETISKFNAEQVQRNAEVFDLDEIKDAYFGEPIVEQKQMTAVLTTINKGTTLRINNQAYGLNLPLDGMYAMIPVTSLYRTLVKAEEIGYPIFDANIREYLGEGRSVNKNIVNTLKTSTERNNFFYYNNGITLICDSFDDETASNGLKVKVENPQIVNGCQTVSSVKAVLKDYSDEKLDDEFRDVYVMAKILVIPKDDEGMDMLRRKIVKYNNSQNSIDEKTFEANTDKFKRIQAEFLDHGFLVCIKQSDKFKFGQQYTKSQLMPKAADYIERFGLSESMTKTNDFMVDLEKLLQVFLAFSGDAYQAFQKKSGILKNGSAQYEIISKAIHDDSFTTEQMLSLYCLYLRSEQEKKTDKDDGRTPITWYLIESFAHFECEGNQYSLISKNLDSPEKVNKVVDLYKRTTRAYLKWYGKQNEGKEYNSMIKEKLDLVQMGDQREIYND